MIARVADLSAPHANGSGLGALVDIDSANQLLKRQLGEHRSDPYLRYRYCGFAITRRTMRYRSLATCD